MRVLSPRRLASALLLCLLAATTPALAHNQTNDVDQDVHVQVYSSSSSSSTSTIMLFAMLVFNPTSTTSSSSAAVFANADVTCQYMRHNAVALQQDMTLGAGRTLQDLAQLGGIAPAHRGAFARAIRRASPQLRTILGDGEGFDQAALARFDAALRQAMRQDAALRQYVAG